MIARPPDPGDRAYFMELYKLYRAQEEHENLLKHNRLTTFLTLQSVVFVTFGLSLQKYFELWEKIHENNWTADRTSAAVHDVNFKFGAFLLALCGVGLLGSHVARVAIQSAIHAQNKVRDRWAEIKKDAAFEELPPFAAGSDVNQDTVRASFSTALPRYFFRLWIFAVVILFIAVFRE